MASKARTIQSAIQVILAILIVVLGYVLYTSIVEPYQRVVRAREVTELTRTRMDMVRQAMIQYERRNGRFVSELDSLVLWLRTDSFMVLRSDSIFGRSINLDSLPYSPRTGKAFVLQVNDTSDVHIYQLVDPDSNDKIGALLPDPTLLNAASWE